MSPIELAILLGVVGVVLLVAELLLPTHGILGVLGVATILAGIIVCFWIDRRLGLGLLVACLAAAPFVGALAMRMWPRTPVGRRLILSSAEEDVLPPPVQPGAIGVATSEMRPMGICEFDGQRLEAASDYGMIAAGTKVRVVNVVDRRPTVRPA